MRGDAGGGGAGGRADALTRLRRAWARTTRRLGRGAATLVRPPLAALLVVAGLHGRPVAAQPAGDVVSADAVRSLAGAPLRQRAGRFTVLSDEGDAAFARSLLRAAVAADTFPGLPRPAAAVTIAIAADEARFRAWVGPEAPAWGAAIAVPARQTIVLRGGRQALRGGDPATILRHELAHLALHEAIGDLPPRWFDEGYASYAAREWGRDEVLTANLALLYRRMPALDSLDRSFRRGEREAQAAYALSHRAVAELAALDPERGLTLFFEHWRETGRLDAAVRRAYGLPLDAFEERWRSSTRRRYGALALAGELTVGAGFALLVVLPLYVLRRRRDRARWTALRVADARRAWADEADAPWAVAPGPEAPVAVDVDTTDATTDARPAMDPGGRAPP